MTSQVAASKRRRARPNRLPWRLVILALLAAAPCHASEIRIEIRGIEGEIEEAVRANLELQQYANRDATPAQVRRLFNRADEQIRAALEPFGYYNAVVHGNLELTDKGYRASFQVEPGERVRVVKSGVRVLGPAQDDPAIQAAVQAFKPALNEPFVHSQYENSKAAVESALLSMGYLDARAVTQRVEISRARNSAQIDLAWQSGPRYRFGAVRFTGGQFPESFLHRFVPWPEGTFYTADWLLALQQRLTESGYFSSVSVLPATQETEGDTVPVDVLLVPGKRNAYLGSIFYGTDSGIGVSAYYERRWLNERGHKLRTEVEYSQRLKTINTLYRIPLGGLNDRSYNFGIAYRDEDTETSQSRNTRVVANETRQWRGFTRTLGLQYLVGDFEVGGEHRNSSLLFLEGSLTRRRADDFVFARRGHSLSLILRGARKGWASDTSFLQARADAKWIRALTRRQRVILRGSLGTTTVENFDELPPDVRFFAGGDRSVRGFDYQELGSLNEAGEVIGGENLVVGSAEYELYFLENWGAAVFVDAGDAFSSSDPDLHVGAGIGVRWRSPVGVVRLDFARPVTTEENEGWRIHVVIGPDL